MISRNVSPLPHRTGSIFAINSHYLFGYTFVFISECTCLDIEFTHGFGIKFNTEGKQTFLQRNNLKKRNVHKYVVACFFFLVIELSKNECSNISEVFFLWLPKRVRTEYLIVTFLCNVLVPEIDRSRVKRKEILISIYFVIAFCGIIQQLFIRTE